LSDITIIFYKECFVEQFKEYLKTNSDSNYIVFPIDENIDISLEFCRHVKHYEDFLSEEELIIVDRDAAHLSCNWYKKWPGNLHSDIPWYVFIEYQMQALFSAVFKQITLLNKIVPAKIVICEENNIICKTVVDYADQKGIKINLIKAKQHPAVKNQLKIEKSKKHRIGDILREVLIRCSNVIFKLRFLNCIRKSALIMPYRHVNGFINELIYDNKRMVYLLKENASIGRKNFGRVFCISPKNKKSTVGNYNFNNFEKNISGIPIEYTGVEIWSIIREFFYEMYVQKIPHIAKMYNCYSWLFENFQFDFVMVNQDFTDNEKILVYCANKKNIQTIVVAHGAFIPPIPMIQPIAEHFYFWDYFSSKYYQDVLGISEKRISLVKNEYLHNLQIDSQFQIENNRKNLGIDKNQKVVLYFCPVWVSIFAYCSPHESAMMLKDICEIMTSLSDVTCIIRFHPSVQYYENKDYKINIINMYSSGNCIIDPGLSLISAISMSNAIIALDTTAIFETLFLKKPILLYNPTMKRIGDFFWENNGVLHAKNKDEVKKTLPVLLSDDGGQVEKGGSDFIRKFCSNFSSIYDTVIEKSIKDEEF
jgi:hypothetical protein